MDSFFRDEGGTLDQVKVFRYVISVVEEHCKAILKLVEGYKKILDVLETNEIEKPTT